MTIVIAKQFGERIVIHSDTAIANEPTGPNVIPGRLKAVVLSPKVSVAFAGAADRADDVVRRSRAILHDEGLRGMLTWLVQNTQATSVAWDDSVSYVVASHLNGPELYRVWDGWISNPLPQTWIGDKFAHDAYRQAEDYYPIEAFKGSDYVSKEEVQFDSAVRQLFYSFRHSSGFLRRGFAINLLASPWGHCYQSPAVAIDPDTITIGPGASNRDSGTSGLWTCNICASRYRGVGVVGALLPQAGGSYIYAPILGRDAVWFPLRTASPDWNDHLGEMFTKLHSELNRVAERVGGGIVVD